MTGLKQMIVRVEPTLVKKLKILAAFHDISMAELVRRTLMTEISEQRKVEAVDLALKAADL